MIRITCNGYTKISTPDKLQNFIFFIVDFSAMFGRIDIFNHYLPLLSEIDWITLLITSANHGHIVIIKSILEHNNYDKNMVTYTLHRAKVHNYKKVLDYFQTINK